MRGDTTLVKVQVSLAILVGQLSSSGLPSASTPPLAVVPRTVWQWPPSDVTPGTNIQVHPRCQVSHFLVLLVQESWWYRYLGTGTL